VVKLDKEFMVQKARTLCKRIALLSTQALLVLSGGSCLPDNLFADVAGDLVNGLIITTVNLALADSGIQI